MTTTEAIDKWIEHEKFNTSYGRTVRNILYRNLGGLFPFIDASTLTEEHVSKGIDSMRTRSRRLGCHRLHQEWKTIIF